MPFAVSEGRIVAVQRPLVQAPYSVWVSDGLSLDYAAIYKTQPAVRMVVSFLARNIAQLGLPVYRRVNDLDRTRLSDHPLSELLGAPNAFTSGYALKRALVSDLAIYDVALWLKVAGDRRQLVRIPPWMAEVAGENYLHPEVFKIRGSRGDTTIPAENFVYFHGYNPLDDRVGLSPLETLRRLLSEELAAGQMREQVLRNGARVSGYLKRPAGAPSWSDAARDKFRSGWKSQYTGWSASQGGGTPILEDGMEFVPAGQSAVDLQYIEARKLTREEVAQAYHIPPPMVGILDHATFSNIEEQHKMLYADTLGPWLEEIQQEIERQLLPEFDDADGVYVEFNLAEKLKGSFEQQASQLQTAVGAPYMTRNEARARMNLPQVQGGDALIVPLNVLEGGQASPTDSGSQNLRSAVPMVKSGRSLKSPEVEQSQHVRKAEELLTRFFGRQRSAVLSALGAKAAGDWWDGERWDAELTADLFRFSTSTATLIGGEQAVALGFDAGDYDEDRTLAFLHAVAKSRAEAVNAATKARLDDALAESEPEPAAVFDEAVSARTGSGSAALVAALAGFAVMEAGKQLVGSRATKTWLVTSRNPRPEHAAMNGETVPIDDTFSNGAQWPGDAMLGADGVAGCMCGLQVDY